MKKYAYTAAVAALVLPLAAAPMKNIFNCETWQRPNEGGKYQRIKPADGKAGAFRFLPDERYKNYSFHAYTHDPAKSNQKKKYRVRLVCSPDMNQGVNITFLLKAKQADNNWYNIFPTSIQSSLLAGPGSEQQMTLEVDLKELKADKIVSVVPYINITGLTQGYIDLVEIDAESSLSTYKPAPRPRGIGIANYTFRDEAIKKFEWPTAIQEGKFKRMMDFTALGLNILKLTPEMQGAAFQWPDNTTIKVFRQNNNWVVESGDAKALKKVLTLNSRELDVAFDGTGATFRGSDKKLHRVEGGLDDNDVSLLMPGKIKTPEIKQIYICDNALLWCCADEAEQALERSAKLYAEQLDVIKSAAWKVASQQGSWEARLRFARSSIAKVKDEAIKAADGFLPALVADPYLRDRYNWLMWNLYNNYQSEGGDFGGVFRRIWYTKLAGRGEIYGALEFARKLENLVARSRRLAGASFKEGVNYQNKLSGGFVSQLALVPQRAGLPVDIQPKAVLRTLRGEAESIQLVLTSARSEVDDIKVKVTPANENAPAIRMERVDYISLAETSNVQIPLSRGGDVPEPDVCVPITADDSFDLNAYSNQAVLLSVWSKGSTPAGNYDYNVTVSVDGNDVMTLPLTVKVEKSVLGTKRFPSIIGYRPSSMPSWFGKENDVESSRNFMKMLMEYRMEPLDLYVFTPIARDLEWAVENGLQAAVLGQFSGLAHPEPTLVKFTHLYGSVDGENFEEVPATFELRQRDPKNPLSDQDLIVTPKASLAKYKYLKLHNSETRGWYDRSGYRFFVTYPQLGTALEMNNGAEKVRDLYSIVQDKDVLHNGMKKAAKAGNIEFDDLRDATNRRSIIWEKAAGEVKDIRLINRRIEVVYGGMKKKYDLLREKGGKDLTIYLYGFDEVAKHLNGRLLSALKNAKYAFPDVKTLTTASNIQATPEIWNYLDFHCPCNAYAISRVERQIAKTRNTKYWTYIGGGGYYPFGNYERVDQMRILSRAFFWNAITFDHIEGHLYWDIHMWRNNMDLREENVDFQKWNPCHGDNNGMGALFYPGANNQTYASMRSSALRDGIEDVEIFRMTRDLVKSSEDRAELEAIRNGFGTGMSIYCKDVKEMESLRNRLFDLLEKVSAK